jgi:hypothetical protein
MSLREHPLELWRRQRDERRRFVAELEALAQRLRNDQRRLGDEAARAGAIARSRAEIDARLSDAGAALAAAERQLQRHELAWSGQPEDSRRRGRRSRR